jgi:DNA helicase-2/ATP-dependent DNA helicase PcrA
MARAAVKAAIETPPGSPIDFAGELNPAQLEAATALEGPYLVIAGAGSGKTRTLVYRVAHLVLRGVPPPSILLLTFTRRAAQEMLRRAASILDERCRRVAGGTYHGFANLTLRRYAKRLDYGERFTIVDRSDAAELIGILRTEGGYDKKGRRFPRKDTILDLLSKQVNTERPLEELLEEDYPQFADDLEDLEDLGRRYAARKKEQNVMDYDDLLVNLRRLLAEHDDVRRKLSAQNRYVMVDEYQDTNRIQAHIGALLASEHGNVMVVGDDAQSIYSFRGADFRNIMEFPRIFPDCRTIKLEQNYRSTQPILDLGNAILERAREKYVKKLWSDVEGDARPAFVRCADANDQAEFICKRVLELREEGVPLAEIAVLARAAWHTNTLEIALQSRNIPFRKFGGLRFVESAHVKDVCALLKLGVNPTDAAAWFRVLQLFEGVGPKTAQQVARPIVEKGGDVAVLTDPKFAKRKYGPDLKKLRKLLERTSDEGVAPAERLEHVLTTYKGWMSKKYDDVKRRQRDLDALRALAERYETVEGFLSDLAIDPPDFGRQESARDEEDEWMTLSTVHSAKGLEWHTVFVIQLNAGQFPSHNSMADPASYEEERRLLYVAVTRAKQNLYLMKPDQTWQRSYSYEVGETSPLLEEVPNLAKLVEEQYFAVQWQQETVEEVKASTKSRLSNIQGYFGS